MEPISKHTVPVPVQKKDPGHDDHQCIEVSREGRSTKIHAVVDGLGYPLVMELTGGQVHNGVMLQKCLDQLQISGSTVLADKAYGSLNNREYIVKHDAEYCIPPKSYTVEPWHCNYEHCTERHLVEAFFMRIKDCRRIAMRFEKLACRFLAFLHLTAALLWLA